VASNDLFWGFIAGQLPVLVPMVGSDMNGDIALNAPLDRRDRDHDRSHD
jgi:hypothetical protein